MGCCLSSPNNGFRAATQAPAAPPAPRQAKCSPHERADDDDNDDGLAPRAPASSPTTDSPASNAAQPSGSTPRLLSLNQELQATQQGSSTSLSSDSSSSQNRRIKSVSDAASKSAKCPITAEHGPLANDGSSSKYSH
ncbi:hypothetical protein CDD81_94 [Ophiocordyceps australis]|uniref:Uncharacterized protein n=1 Tax=Ophiocordyceps australis TaxID=1399860 RepID=A0A2C5YIL1_9HYPO|nr:hypothetical protein CDD81_94 [Ophiocordyceps australis]